MVFYNSLGLTNMNIEQMEQNKSDNYFHPYREGKASIVILRKWEKPLGLVFTSFVSGPSTLSV